MLSIYPQLLNNGGHGDVWVAWLGGGGAVWGSHCSRGTLRQFGVNSDLPISMEVNQYDKTGIAMPVHAQSLVSGMSPLVCSPRFSISASAYLGSFWQGCLATLLESQ